MKVEIQEKKWIFAVLFCACLLGCAVKLLALPGGFRVDSARVLGLYPELAYSARGLEISGKRMRE